MFASSDPLIFMCHCIRIYIYHKNGVYANLKMLYVCPKIALILDYEFTCITLFS